jgi:hypothetical protein
MNKFHPREAATALERSLPSWYSAGEDGFCRSTNHIAKELSRRGRWESPFFLAMQLVHLLPIGKSQQILTSCAGTRLCRSPYLADLPIKGDFWFRRVS